MGVIQREHEKIEELIKNKSRIYIILNTIANLFRLVGKERHIRRQPKTDSLSMEEVENARNFIFQNIQKTEPKWKIYGPAAQSKGHPT